MEKGIIRWVNPVTGLKHILGKHFGNGIYVNKSAADYLRFLGLRFNESSTIYSGGDGTIYHVNHNGKRLAVKRYSAFSPENGILQFMAMRKINEAGIESPRIYAASESALVMEYVPHVSLDYILAKDFVEGNEQISREWHALIKRVKKILPESEIDDGIENGYIASADKGYKMGIFDQG